MKSERVVWLAAIWGVGVAGLAPAAPKPESRREFAEAGKPAAAERAVEWTREHLEKQFERSLTGAVLEGIWQVTGKGGLDADEPLSEPKKERYTIASAVKTGDEHWIISARIQYGETDVTVPVLVRVVWAGDTPIITLDDLAIPMIGTYSARVMFHRGFYSGVWYSNAMNYGGILSGRIVKPKNADKTEKASDAPEGK